MKKHLSVLIILSLLLSTATPSFAQETAQDESTAQNTYLPFVNVGEDTVVESEEADTITELSIPHSQVASTRAIVTGASTTRLRDLRIPDLARGLDVQLPPDKLNLLLGGKEGRQRVIVQLTAPSLAEQMRASRSAEGVVASSVAAQQATLAAADAQQATVLDAALTLDANTSVIGQVNKVLNAVLLEADASALALLAQNPAVKRIAPIGIYKKTLAETVPYIGATAVQNLGFKGKGIDVAVVDSGIDYLHVHLGGSGVVTDFVNNDPSIIENGTFPTAKVVGGYDFVGSLWNGSTITKTTPDADPLDDGLEGGHGTHVADIIGGKGGVAPGVNLYALKVCSSVATTCEGAALIFALEYAADPNGDDDTDDHVDVVNMSLGSDYGQAFDDDLSFATDNLSELGVVVVAAAGNGADKPYVAGTPANAPSAISVAQTQVPSASQARMRIVSPAAIAGLYLANHQVWSAAYATPIEGPVQYADGAGGNLNGCAAFAAGTLTGKIVLVNRGTCNISIKVSNGAAGGALAVIIGLIAPGDPTDFSFGGGTPSVPGFNISQADANRIKANLTGGVTVRFDPADRLPIVKHMVGSSARGPSMGSNIIKPEIAAPGASVSAIAGSGTGVEAFGGTSGAAPMLSGAAALLLDAYPSRDPEEIKALLMNTGETNIINRPLGILAAITRIGGGEVRVDKALAATAIAYNDDEPTAAISFGFVDVYKAAQQLKRTIKVQNYADDNVTFDIAYTFRYASDQALNAVALSGPSSIKVSGKDEKSFDVKLTINGENLLEWIMNSGSLGASSNALTLQEIDGYIVLTDRDNPANTLHLPWQVLPRKEGNVSIDGSDETVRLRNHGVTTSTIEVFSLIGKSKNLPAGKEGANNPIPDLRYLGYATIPVDAGFCNDTASSFLLQFAFNSWERQTHANAPAEFDVFLDLDQDGKDDFNIFNFELSGQLIDGRNVVVVLNLATGEFLTPFFTNHTTNSANTVLTICAEDIGLTEADLGKPMKIVATAADFYHVSFNFTDSIGPMTITPGGERYAGIFDDGVDEINGFYQLASKERVKLSVVEVNEESPNDTESGLLLLYRPGAKQGKEAAIIEVHD